MPHQPRLDQIIGHHLRAGREAGLDPRLRFQTASRPPSSPAARGDHHRRVRRVRATGDGGDHHGAVLHVRMAASFGARVALPRRRCVGRCTPSSAWRRQAAAAARARTISLTSPSAHAVLRPARAGQARLDRGQVELQRVRVHRLRRTRRRGTAPVPWCTPRRAARAGSGRPVKRR